MGSTSTPLGETISFRATGFDLRDDLGLLQKMTTAMREPASLSQKVLAHARAIVRRR